MLHWRTKASFFKLWISACYVKRWKALKCEVLRAVVFFSLFLKMYFEKERRKGEFFLKLLCAKCYPSHEIFILPAGAGMKSHILELRRRELYSKWLKKAKVQFYLNKSLLILHNFEVCGKEKCCLNQILIWSFWIQTYQATHNDEKCTTLCVWSGRDATSGVKQVLVVKNKILHDAQIF